jgi:hypothetical protein
MRYETVERKTRRHPHHRASAIAVPYEALDHTAWTSGAPSIATSLLADLWRLRRRNRGISRWLAIAVLAGAIAALGVIHFLAH